MNPVTWMISYFRRRRRLKVAVGSLEAIDSAAREIPAEPEPISPDHDDMTSVIAAVGVMNTTIAAGG